MVCTIYMAFVFGMASLVVQANQCSNASECLIDDTSLIQAKLHVDLLSDGEEDASKVDSKPVAKQAKRVADTVMENQDQPATAQQKVLSVSNQIRNHMWKQHQSNVAAIGAAADTLRSPSFWTATHREMMLCLVAVALIISTIVFLYWVQGLFAIKVLIYLLALSTMKATVKVVVGNSFNFPLFLTAVHFGTCSIIAFAMLLYNSWSNSVEVERPSRRLFATRFFPIVVAFAAEVSLDNMALVYSTSAFCEIVEACDPVVTVLMILAMQKPFDIRLLAPCLVVVVGCALTVDGERGFSMLGFILVAGSSLPHAFKDVLTAELLCQQDADTKVYSPIAVLAWVCLPASMVMLIWSLFQEGTMPYHQIYAHGFVSHLTIAISLCTMNACILTTAMLFVMKDLGAVGVQVVAAAKGILVVLIGIFVLKEDVSRNAFAGYFVIMAGVYAYNRLSSKAGVGEASGKEAVSCAKDDDLADHPISVT